MILLLWFKIFTLLSILKPNDFFFIFSLLSDFNFLTTFSGIDLSMSRRRRVEGHIHLPLSVRLSVCPSVRSSVCPFVRLSVRPSVGLSVRSSIRPFVRPFVRPSVCPSVYPFVRLSVRPSVRTSVRPSVRSSVRPFVRPSVCQSVRLSVHPFVHSSVWPSVRLSVRPFVRPSVCPSRYRYMVCSTISPYSFRATALIFCRMFIHIMEVCMSTGFWFSANILKTTGNWSSFPSYGQGMASFVSYRHTSFLKIHS